VLPFLVTPAYYISFHIFKKIVRKGKLKDPGGKDPKIQKNLFVGSMRLREVK